jgi:hypothetical protein
MFMCVCERKREREREREREILAIRLCKQVDYHPKKNIHASINRRKSVVSYD